MTEKAVYYDGAQVVEADQSPPAEAVVSVPGSATRAVKDYLGLDHLYHPMEAVKPAFLLDIGRLYVPIKDPLDILIQQLRRNNRNWARRFQNFQWIFWLAERRPVVPVHLCLIPQKTTASRIHQDELPAVRAYRHRDVRALEALIPEMLLEARTFDWRWWPTEQWWR